MIRNVFIKKMLKHLMTPCLTVINKIIPKDDRNVFLYSANGGIIFSLVPLRDYLLKNKYDAKYSIICGIRNMSFAEDLPRVKFVSGVKSVFVFFRAKHVFYTAGQLPIRPSKSQCVIHLRHGNANFKPIGLLTNINNGDEFFFTYMIAPSEFFIPIMAKEYACPESCIKVAGDPMTDALLNSDPKAYDFSQYAKMLLWLPTFRQSDFIGYNDSSYQTLVPLFETEDYPQLNGVLAKHNIKLIVKLHPSQNSSIDTQRHFSHVSVYSHKEFVSSGYDMMKLMACSDGLIGDYSSASMQYLLTDHPQAFVVPDIEEYKSTRGFIFDNPEEYMAGHIIKEKNEFFKFIDDFAKGRDIYKEKRHWVCNQIYKYKDANSCKRILKLSGMSL